MKRIYFIPFLFLLFACQQQASSPSNDRLVLTPVDIQDVRLLDGPYQHAMIKDGQWLQALEPDRLLHRYRLYAGLEPKGEIYGGWESRGISGHSLGHYISACAMMYAATGEAVYKERVDYITSELQECQEAMATGYIGAIPGQDSVWLQVAAGDIRSQGFDLNGLWVPWYTQHKLLAGLVDAYAFAGNDAALSVARKFSDWIDTTFDGLTEEQFQEMLTCEFGGMNDILAKLYQITGDEKYLKLARRFYHQSVLDPLANQTDQLSGQHANTQIPKIVGAAKLYELKGDTKDSTIAAYFLRTVLNDHSYANGGNSEHEHFGAPRQLEHRLSESTSETCNTYNMIKLTQHVNTWEFDGQWGDYIEKALINHILASQNPETGMVCYFVPLDAGGEKTYSDPFDSFWCCVGSGWENHAKYGGLIYYEAPDQSVVIDQYIASALTLDHIRLTQKSDYPESALVRIEIKDVDEAFQSLYLRIPAWSRGHQVTLNGKPISGLLTNGYLKLDEKWAAGDEIALSLAMDLHAEELLGSDKKIAMFYGPTLLAGALPQGMEPHNYPVFLADNEGYDWIDWDAAKMSGKTQVGYPQDVVMMPFYQLYEQPYVVYLDRYNEEDWANHKEKVEAERRAQEILDTRTMDVLRIGEMQPERDHELVGENTESGEAFNRKWRHATDGWFAFQMTVDPQASNELMVTYWGGDAGNREFQVLADGQIIATQKLERNRPDEFYDEVYELPRNVTQGKQKVSIRFESLPGKTAGGVYGVRMLRAQ
ncbi:beta-L-arabinofuranosidase domain-containing protein [Reichenbachiella sp. 5M10]|uniref:beta-L-arabinofuranosidase domain-containing protein n=1 Tax=Reichenbachiella sp. 5M10 TaxID=1889772 RepID=UPI0013040472|nr:beta-L-arabinofuranosidase domain-containing protein [Reichenbachiella sp. 5M10]